MLQFNNNSTLEKVTRIKCGIAMCKKFACGQSYLLPIVETSNLFNYIRCLNCSDERLWQIERKKKTVRRNLAHRTVFCSKHLTGNDPFPRKTSHATW
jgi:hypothetical protein